jgi:hypothetical protein
MEMEIPNEKGGLENYSLLNSTLQYLLITILKYFIKKKMNFFIHASLEPGYLDLVRTRTCQN